jgi:hypothetical protein
MKDSAYPTPDEEYADDTYYSGYHFFDFQLKPTSPPAAASVKGEIGRARRLMMPTPIRTPLNATRGATMTAE